MPTATLTDKLCARQPGQKTVSYWDAATPGFGIRISPKGKRTFMVQTRVHGRQRRAVIGHYPAMSLAAARAAAADMKDRAAKGEPIKAAAPAYDGTFKGLAETYLRTGVSRKTKRPVRELRTYDEIKRKLEVDLYPEWKDRPVSEITSTEIRRVVREKRAVSPISGERLLEVIKAMFRWAVGEGLVDADPASGIPAQYVAKRRERVLSIDEIRAVWTAAEAQGYPFGPMAQLLLLTAQRRQEVAGMAWSELDLGKAEWIIPAARAKNGREHLVPLSPRVVALLDKLPVVGPYVFTTDQEGARPVSGFAKAKARLDTLLDKGGLIQSHWTFHDLRRTAATTLERLGVDPYTIGQILNHSPAGITRRTYALYDRALEKRAALERWANEVDRIMNGTESVVLQLRGATCT